MALQKLQQEKNSPSVLGKRDNMEDVLHLEVVSPRSPNEECDPFDLKRQVSSIETINEDPLQQPEEPGPDQGGDPRAARRRTHAQKEVSFETTTSGSGSGTLRKSSPSPDQESSKAKDASSPNIHDAMIHQMLRTHKTQSSE